MLMTCVTIYRENFSCALTTGVEVLITLCKMISVKPKQEEYHMALKDYIENKPVIETDRLIIRPLVSSDTYVLKEWMPDRSIYT